MHLSLLTIYIRVLLLQFSHRLYFQKIKRWNYRQPVILWKESSNMLLLFQCRKCGKFFCLSKHYTASVSNICCVKIITPCNINRQRILMIPCFIFYRNSEYACKDISYSHFNLVLLKVKFLSYLCFWVIFFLSYFKFMQTVAQTHFSHSKADFCEMLPDTLLFREYLFADSYSFRGQVHFWKKKNACSG